MKYRSILVSQHGGPEVLQIVEKELRPPAAGEARIRVLAASVSRPDVTVRRGESLYRGTPLDQKLPFTPGYAVIGEVDAVGEGVEEMIIGKRVGVLTVTGGYTEILYWKSDRLIPVLEAAKATALLESGSVVGNVVLVVPEQS
jgi:NADPH:quinone reductase-like Zn-dependent oxidoreductase